MQWHADSSWMWVTEFTRAMPVESSTRPASIREQTETATDPGAFQKPKPAIGNLESQVRARQRWIDAKGETTSREKNWASAYCRHLPTQFRAG